MSSEAKKMPTNKGDNSDLKYIPDWDDTGESLLRYEWTKIRYEGP